MNSGQKDCGGWGWPGHPPLPHLRPASGRGRGFAVTRGSRRDGGPVCIQSLAIPSALSPNAVNGFSQLLNRQLPPALAASRSSRGARPRPAGTQSACVAAGSRSPWAQVSKLFVGTPGAQPARLCLPGGLPPPRPASELGHWPGPGPPHWSARAGPRGEGRQPALQTHAPQVAGRLGV